MANKKLAERKKRRRIEEKKQVALKRQAAAVADRQQRAIERKVEKMLKPKQTPHRNVVDGVEPTFSKQLSREEIIARLNHNLEILKALEEEYDREMEIRQERNSDLENQGFSELKDKMDALHRQAVEQQKEEGLAFGGEADVVFTPNSEEIPGDV